MGMKSAKELADMAKGGRAPETGGAGSSDFASNTITYARVKEVRPNSGLLIVTCEGDPMPKEALFLANVFSSKMFGVRSYFLPPAGARVVCINPGVGPLLVIGGLPEQVDRMAEEEGYPRNSSKFTDAPDYTSFADNVVDRKHKENPGYTPVLDLVEGEHALEGGKGVLWGLLHHMAVLQAGDRARIECLLLDDMVRIFSENYAHHSALGDLTIRNDHGKLNLEWNATTDDFERDGLSAESDPRIEVDAGGKRPISPSPERQAEDLLKDGRWRFSLFMGWVGDFINLFVTDPPAAAKLMDGESQEDANRSGKSRFTVGPNGELLLQSCSDIVLERVTRIPVPIRKRSPYDTARENPNSHPSPEPSVETARDFPQSTLKEEIPPPLEPDWTVAEGEDISTVVYNIRHYARWLNHWVTMRKFHALANTFDVPSETETPEPDIVGYEERYSTIRIFRDGSQMLMDSYGNSIVMNAHGVTVSSSTDLRLEAAGNLFAVAGGQTAILSKGDVSIRSDEGNLLLSARDTLLQVLESSKVLISAAKTYMSDVLEVVTSVATETLKSNAHEIKGHTIDVEKGTKDDKSDKVTDGALAPGAGVEITTEEFTEVTPAAGDWHESVTQQGIDGTEWSPAKFPQENIKYISDPGEKLDVPQEDMTPFKEGEAKAHTEKPFSFKTK
jgi:hypothetical protein